MCVDRLRTFCTEPRKQAGVFKTRSHACPRLRRLHRIVLGVPIVLTYYWLTNHSTMDALIQDQNSTIHYGQRDMINAIQYCFCLIYLRIIRIRLTISVIPILALWMIRKFHQHTRTKQKLKPYHGHDIRGHDDEIERTVFVERGKNSYFRLKGKAWNKGTDLAYFKHLFDSDDMIVGLNDGMYNSALIELISKHRDEGYRVKISKSDIKLCLKDSPDLAAVTDGSVGYSLLFRFKKYLNNAPKEGSNLVVPPEFHVYHLATSNHPKEVHGIPWKHLNNERFRLMTFVEFPTGSELSTILLASKGFAYFGNGSNYTIICCFCSTVLTQLGNLNYIDEQHRRMRQECPLVKGVHCGNVSMKSQYPKNAESIFSKLRAGNKNESLNETPLDNANSVSENEQHNAVRSSQPSDESASYTIVTNTTDLEEGDSAAQNQSQSSQLMDDSASALQDQTVSVISSPVPNDVGPTTSQTNEGPTMSSTPQENSQQSTETSTNGTEDPSPGDATSYEKLGIITARPKRPDYAVLATRLNSYNEWPAKHHMKPNDLARAGFFYNGYSDCARCFYCGGGLRNWEPEDNVWVEHARWFSKCAFLLQEVGKDFIDAVQAMSKERDVIGYADVEERLRRDSSSASILNFKDKVIEKDPAVLSVIDNGFDKDRVLELALEIRKSGELLSSDKLYEEAKLRKLPHTENVNNLGSDSVSIRKGGNMERDRETVETLRSENGELRQQTTCKICMDMEVAVVFLPCGHFVSCTECSCALTACPLCRVGIKGIVRAYMG